MTLLQPHTSVFLDASTTNLALAKVLPDISLNIFTTGPSIALELCRLHNPVVSLCCGTLNRNNLSISGQNTLEMLEKINIDVAFMGVSGCSVDAGFTCGTESDMLVKRLVIKNPRTSVIMCGHEKFTSVEYLVSDIPVSQPFAAAAQAAGIKLL